MTVLSLTQRKAEQGGTQPDCTPSVVHLPVAPQVTALTRFSPVMPNRLSFMTPEESLDYLNRVCDQCDTEIATVAITGPGDPLAVPDTTMRTVELVKSRYPDMEIALRTLGFGAEKFAASLADVGVSHIELIVNGVKADVLEKLYAWIRPGLKTLKIADAVKLLIREQKNGVPALRYHDIAVSVVTTLYPAINQRHIGTISRKMMELGAESMSVDPYIPEPGCEVTARRPDETELEKCRATAAQHLPVSASPLGDNPPYHAVSTSSPTTGLYPKPSVDKPNIGVVSSSGVEVDMHLGKASRFLVYGPREDGLACLLEVRDGPKPGGGPERWKTLSEVLGDCFVLLAAQAGKAPRQILSEHRLPVLITDDQIEGIVDLLYGGGKKKK